ncbi:MAG: M28 family peptidase [Sneathiella sp.]|uniref:M28 family metallopeptidase n=1 Tax=Sneathiella sp. TaxID=1964365 RepID=UPI003001A820
MPLKLKLRNAPLLWMVALLLGLSGCATPIKKGPDFSYYLENPSPYRLVEVMSGRSNEERLHILTEALTASEIPYELDPFTIDGKNGTNAFADLGPIDAPTLIIVAHYDRVMGSAGANDNASCVASVISAYEMLRAAGPLKNINVRFLFPDKEEVGLIGTQGYIKNHGVENVLGVASFEMCGIGDAFGIWDLRDNLESSKIVKAIQQAGKDLGVHNETHGPVPRYSSDHHRFYLTGIPAVGVTVLPEADGQTLRDYIANPNAFRWIRTANRPTIFQTYHSPQDLPSTIDPKALDMTAHIIVETAKIFDQLSDEK